MQHLKRIKNEPYYQFALLLYFNNVSKKKEKYHIGNIDTCNRWLLYCNWETAAYTNTEKS